MEAKWKSAGQILLIPAENIKTNPLRSRSYYNDDRIEELSASIEQHGILEPLAVTPTEEESFLLLSGERRFRAAVKTGLTELPCILYAAERNEAAVFSLINNEHQTPLHYFEEAEAIEKLRTNGLTSIADLSETLSKPESYLLNKLRFLSIPKDIRIKMLEYGMNESYASIIIKLDSDRKKRELTDRIAREQLTLAEAQAAAKEAATKRKGKIVTFFSDLTVFTNTVERAIETLLSSGMKATSQKEETADSIRYIISIRKPG